MRPITNQAYQLLHEGVQALSIMEGNGIKIDEVYLRRQIKDITDEINKAEGKLKTHKIYKAWSKEFRERLKIDSHEQLGVILFDKMGYDSPGLTDGKKVRHKADEESLKTTGSPFVELWIKVQKLKKARGTYLKGILREVQNGFIHPFFNLHLTQTYRGQSDHPNFQNIPIRIEEIAKYIRSAFIPRSSNRQLVEIDYGGVEVCCACAYHCDPNMIEYQSDETKDLHRDMAGECFLLPISLVDKVIRYVSKNRFVFPSFYGSFYSEIAKNLWEAIEKLDLKNSKSEESLYQHLMNKGIEERGDCDSRYHPEPGTFEHHIQKVENRFWNKKFPVYKQWKVDWWEDYCNTLGFDTLTGFHIEGVMKKTEVINYPVQGSAFHWLLWSIIKIQKLIQKYKLRVLLVGQIHDSLVADSHKDDTQNYLEICYKVMTQDIRKHWEWINVPLKIDAEVSPPGRSWYEKEERKILI